MKYRAHTPAGPGSSGAQMPVARSSLRDQGSDVPSHDHRDSDHASRRERRVLAVVGLTAVTMVAEIVIGYAAGSMALLADGWHMATHVCALGLASVAYAVSRRYSSHPAFAFGTGKVRSLAGYTSAVILGFVALAMIVESVGRLVNPREIDFASSLPVAVVGFVVNALSVVLLHDHGHGEHGHGHVDHNHRAALMHVLADTLTSALAIGAILAGRYLGWVWLDAGTGILGGLVILAWGGGLCRRAALDLLDVDTSPSSAAIRETLEALEGVRVHDLRVWSSGEGRENCVVTLESATRRETRDYREVLRGFGLAHLTIEVRRPVDDLGVAAGGP